MAIRGGPPAGAESDGRGADGDDLLRRDAVPGGAAGISAVRPCPRPRPRRARTARTARPKPPPGRPRTEDAFASDAGLTGTRPARVAAFLHWGSWIGGDRDGNPAVTAELTRQVPRIHADHLLHGYEAVATRLLSTIAVYVSREDVRPALETRLARDAEELPDTMRDLARRYPDEPYRRRLGAIAERLRRTRAYLTEEAGPFAGRYTAPEQLVAELDEMQRCLVVGSPGAGGLRRGPGLPVAGRDLRVPPCVSRAPAALGSARGRPGGAAGRGGRAGSRARAGTGRHPRRGPLDVPGGSRNPATLRRRGVPPLRDQLHALPRRRAASHGPGRRGRRSVDSRRDDGRLPARLARPGRRATLRVE